MSPKTFIAKNIVNINNVAFTVDGAGNITAINVNCEVNFGEMGLGQTVDVWNDLTAAQKMAAQNFYDRLKRILNNILIE